MQSLALPTYVAVVSEKNPNVKFGFEDEVRILFCKKLPHTYYT